jgi:CubicO group peptidase (beta-lactamase class C family)
MNYLKKGLSRVSAFVFTIILNQLGGAQTGLTFEAFTGMDSVIMTFLRTWKVGGGSVALVKDGSLVYSKGFGYIDFSRSVPADPNNLYRIASISKPVTSLAIMKLVEEGKLSLSQKVFGAGQLLDDNYYLEEISDPRIYDITVTHLLEHTSGWDRNVPYGPFRHCDPAFFPLTVTEVEGEPNPVGDSTLIRFNLHHGLNYAPGTHYSYSNIGYLV